MKSALFKLERCIKSGTCRAKSPQIDKDRGCRKCAVYNGSLLQQKKWARKKPPSLSVTCQRQAASTTPVAAVWRVECVAKCSSRHRPREIIQPENGGRQQRAAAFYE